MKKKVASVWLLIMFCSTVCLAQGIADLNTIMMRTTFKLEGNGSIGTAFVVGKPDGTNTLRFVIVTASHVLEGMRGDTARLHLRKKIDDSFQRLPFDIRIRDGATNLWVKHPEADVAALYIAVPTDADMPILDASRFFADDDFLKQSEIHSGDEVFALGFPFAAEANEAGFPILRGGPIASYPLLPTRQVKTFLFDFAVYRGNSGSPVYIYQINRIVGAKMPTVNFCRIMGLVSEEKLITEQISSLYENRQEQHPLSVAVVIHATLIQDTIALLNKKGK